MINIGEHRNLKPVEDEWRKLLSEFLFGIVKVYLVTGRKKNKRKYFNSRYDKAIGIIDEAHNRRKIDASEKRNLQNVLCDYKKEFNDIAIGSKSCFANWEKKTFSPKELIVLKNIFIPFYEAFSEKHGAKLLSKLNVRTCPYCNREYTFVIKKDGKSKFQARPEFDHFYDKASYPFFALSFYNLIPCCHTCNHGKGNECAKINPYFDGFAAKLRVVSPYDKRPMNANSILNIRHQRDFNLDYDGTSKDENVNISTFGLRKQYEQHRDYVVEMIEKANAYTVIQNVNLVDAFQGIYHSPIDVFDFVWGKYLQDAELEKRPLSKLTKDILEQLNIKK